MRTSRKHPGLEDSLRLLKLVRAHLAGTGSGEPVTRLLETWSDDERFAALQCAIPMIISMASEQAPAYDLTIAELVDRWEASILENEEHRLRLIKEQDEDTTA